jgi:hypothetical protein
MEVVVQEGSPPKFRPRNQLCSLTRDLGNSCITDNYITPDQVVALIVYIVEYSI